MAQKFSGTPFTAGEETREVVAKSPTPPQRQPANPHAFIVDKSLVDFLFSREEALAQKQIVDYDALIRGMMHVASVPLSPNAPDTIWSNFLTQLMNRAVQLGSKGVRPR